MKKTTQLTFVIAVVFLWMGSGIDVTAPLTPGVGPEIMTVNNQAGFVENPTPGLVREVTAYNVGVRGQTSDRPCLGATGKTCAASSRRASRFAPRTLSTRRRS